MECLRNGAVTDLKDMQVGVAAWGAASGDGHAHLRRRQAAGARPQRRRHGQDVRGLEVVAPRNFALVCFRSKPRGDDGEDACREENREIMERLNRSGKAFLTHTVVGDKFICCGSRWAPRRRRRGTCGALEN
ncbi:hypothetical protein EJB05_38952, partial [Eragrostis curvula]